MSTDYRALVARMISGEDGYETRATLCLDPRTAAAFAAADTAHNAALLAAPRDEGDSSRRPSGGAVAEAKKALEAARAAYEAASVEVVFRALPEPEWMAMRLDWRRRSDEPNIEHTSNVEVIAAHFARFEKDGEPVADLTLDDLKAMLPHLPAWQVSPLVSRAIEASQAGPDLPS